MTRSPRIPAMLQVVVCSMLLVALVTPALAQRSKRQPRAKHQLKIATVAPDGSTWMTIMREMDAAIREATENRVGIKFYPSSVQGDELMVLRKIRAGQLHGGGFTGQGIGALAPELRVLELPFLFDNDDEVDAVRAELNPRLESFLDDQGYVLLGWADVGFIYLFTNAPVRAPEDLRQVKMWLWEGDPLATAFFEEFGVSPIPLGIIDVLTSLQTGLIDGVYATPLACLALQWFTRVRYMTDLPLIHAIGAMVVDRRAWDKIPESDRPLVRQVADEHFARLTAATRQGDRDAIKTMTERGMELVAVDAGEVQTFVEQGRAIWLKQADNLYPRALLDEVTAALAAARAGTDAGD